MAGTHSFRSLCVFIFTDKPAIFAASTSACVCSKTLFQSIPSLEQASSELGNVFNPLVADIKRLRYKRPIFPPQRCIMVSYILEKQASTYASPALSQQQCGLHTYTDTIREIYPRRAPSSQTASGSVQIKSIVHLK